LQAFSQEYFAKRQTFPQNRALASHILYFEAKRIIIKRQNVMTYKRYGRSFYAMEKAFAAMEANRSRAVP